MIATRIDIEFNKAVAFLLKKIAFLEDQTEMIRESISHLKRFNKDDFFNLVSQNSELLSLESFLNFMRNNNSDITPPEAKLLLKVIFNW